MREILVRLLLVAAILVCCAAIAVLIPVAQVAWDVRDDARAAVTSARLIADRGATTLQDVERVLGEAETAIAELRGTAAGATQTLEALEPVLAEAKKTVEAGGQLLVAATGAVDRTEKAIDPLLADLRSELTPTLKHARHALFQVDEALPDFLNCSDANASCLYNRWVGLSREAERTMRAVSASASRVEKAVPNFLVTWDRIGQNSNRTAESTAEVMGNFARATRPLPLWMRVGLAIAPPVVQVGATVVTTMAVTGRK